MWKRKKKSISNLDRQCSSYLQRWTSYWAKVKRSWSSQYWRIRVNLHSAPLTALPPPAVPAQLSHRWLPPWANEAVSLVEDETLPTLCHLHCCTSSSALYPSLSKHAIRSVHTHFDSFTIILRVILWLHFHSINQKYSLALAGSSAVPPAVLKEQFTVMLMESRRRSVGKNSWGLVLNL